MEALDKPRHEVKLRRSAYAPILGILLSFLALIWSTSSAGPTHVVALDSPLRASLQRAASVTPTTPPEGSWKLSGPFGGHVLELATSPRFAFDNTILAGTENGVQKSTDGGESWARLPGLEGETIRALEVSPNLEQDGILFAGTASSGLWRTQNSGDTWELVGQGWLGADAEILALAISPRFRQDGTIYASVAGRGIFKSADEGETWALVLAPVADGIDFLALAVSPSYASDSTVFAGSADGTFFKSRTGGQVWGHTTIGVGQQPVPLLCFAVSPQYGSDQTLYVGTRGMGVMISMDGGANWNNLSPFPDASALALAPDFPSDRRILAAFPSQNAVYISKDGGVNWTDLVDGLGDAFVDTLCISPNVSQDQLAWAGTRGDGVFKIRIDASRAWRAANKGLGILTIEDIALSPLFASDGIAFAGARNGGAYRTINGGQTWDAVNRGLPAADRSVYSLIVSPSTLSMGTVFAGGADGRIFRSPRSLVNWTQVFTLPAVSLIDAAVATDFAVSPSFSRDGTIFFVTNVGTMFKSTDSGAKGSWHALPILFGVSWQCAAISPTYSESAGAGIDQTLFVGGEQGVVVKTEDGGRSWRVLGTGLPADAIVYDLALSPNYADDGMALAAFGGTTGGIVYSTNWGQDWRSMVNFGDNSVLSIAFSPRFTEDGVIYAGTERGGVFRSNNCGSSWAEFNEALGASEITALAVSSADQPVVLAGTAGYGVWRFAYDATAPTPTPTLQGTPTFTSTPTESPTWTLTATQTGTVTPSLTEAWTGTPTATPSPTTTATGIPDASATFTPSSTPSPTSNPDVTPTPTGAQVLRLPAILRDYKRPQWERAGLDGYAAKSVAIDPGNPQVAYAGTSVGLFRHPYCDSDWFGVTMLPDVGVYTIKAAPSPKRHLFAGTWGQGVYRSTDGGVTWSPINEGLPCPYINALAISPDYALDGTLYVATDTDGIYRSTDEGLTWHSANVGLTSLVTLALVVDPSNPLVLNVGTFDRGTFRSTDGGGNWLPVSIGNQRVWTLTTSQTSPTVLYAGTSGGVFRSANGGASWTATDVIPQTYSLAVDPADAGHVIAGTSGSGVFVTSNGGGEWTAMSYGLGNLFVQALAIDPVSCGVLYAATDDGIWSWALP